jgi:hypothetical protein
MSAKYIPALTPEIFDQLTAYENSEIGELNREMTQNLKVLEQSVKEAKTLVHQTQSKVEELALSLEKIKEPKK